MLEKGPVVTEISFGPLKFYKKGIFDNKKKCKKYGDPDSYALLVGHGNQRSTRQLYWLLKVNYGTDFGENGYIRIIKSSENKYGICGIGEYPAYFDLVVPEANLR